MTKKDYIIIAKCMNEVYSIAFKIWDSAGQSETEASRQASGQIYAIQQILGKMFVEFKKDNAKFDWQKFKAAVYKKD